MNIMSIMPWIGVFFMAAACIWSVIAAPLSANKVISVVAEFASYRLALFGVLMGGWLYRRFHKQPIDLKKHIYEYVGLAVALLVVIASLDKLFRSDKLRI
jgi:hypothetical protein